MGARPMIISLARDLIHKLQELELELEFEQDPPKMYDFPSSH